MRNAVRTFLLIYILFAAVFILMKPVFMLLYSNEIGASASDWTAVIYHGFSMDLSVAAYFTILPGLLLTAGVVPISRISRIIPSLLNLYMIAAAAVVAFLYTLDFGLYGSWGFRLDSTPFFYIFTSPSSALASLQWWHYPVALLSIILIFLLIYIPFRRLTGPYFLPDRNGRSGWREWLKPIGMLLLSGTLFLPIRGSLTVSTMNPSRAYFSTNQRLNHAALNPLFTLLYSASHQTDFASQYRFMSDEDAASTVARLLFSSPTAEKESADSLAIEMASPQAADYRPNVVFIILESFSAHLLPSLGGENVAPGLDSLAREGISFTNFYASSFRTDRGLVAILSSFPAPTNTSLLKYVDKFENLPSLPGELKRQGGYNLNYYYGGDANFTNMQAYLVSMGFDRIISDSDFPLSEKTSKWGAHDDVLFHRAFADLSISSSGPSFTVVQTSSSHEPFKVPYRSPLYPTDSEDDVRRNAFAFTDSCLFSFVDSLRTLPHRDNTIVVITADHYGCYPRNLSSAIDRHHIPLIILGAGESMVIPKLSMQTDIGATLLSLLGLDSSRLKYSRNILSPHTAPAAIFTEPSLVGIVTPKDTLIYNPDADAVIRASSAEADSVTVSSTLLPGAKGFLRDLYSTLGSLGRQ